MTCEEYCKSREGKEWLGQDTDYVLGHIREIEKLAQDCMLRALGTDVKYRDCPKCEGYAETRNGHECDHCGATGEIVDNEGIMIDSKFAKNGD